MELSKKNKMNEIKQKGKAIVLAGLVLIGSGANLAKAKATVPASGEREVSFMEMLNNDVLDIAFINPKTTKLTDIRDQGQIKERANEIIGKLRELGLHDFKEQEVINMITLIGGQNPFDRQVENEDVAFLLNRLAKIMNQESVNSALHIRDITGSKLRGKVFDYSLFTVDDHLGGDIIEVMQHYRHGMVLNPTKEGAFPYANALLKYLVHVYLENGYLDYPSFHEAETSGERLLGILLAQSSAALVSAVGITPSYQSYEVIEGKPHYCHWDIQSFINAINQPICYDGENNLVNYLSHAMIGTIDDANYLSNSYTKK